MSRIRSTRFDALYITRREPCATVGYATDWLALKLMFEPIEPVMLGSYKLQGAFLKRQVEVSGEFASLLQSRVLTAADIWREILTGSRAPIFFDILERQTRAQMAVAKAEPLGKAACAVLGPAGWAEVEEAVVARVKADLPSHLPLVYGYSDKALDLERTLR